MSSPAQERQLLGLDHSLVRLIAVVSLGAIMSLLDATIVNVAIDTLRHEFDTSLSTVGWVTTSYLLAFAVSIPIAGWAVDRFGSRRVWLFGLVSFTAASMLAGLAPTIELLVTFRVLQGLTGGMLEPTMMTVLARAAGPTRVGRVLGLSAIPITMGPILGPVLGGFLLEYASWHWLFFVNLPIGLAAIWLAWRYIPRDHAEADTTQLFDVRGVALLSPGFALLIYAISEIGHGRGIGDPAVWGAALASLAFLAAYGAYALRTPIVPIIDLRMFANRSFSGSVGVIMLLGMTFISSGFLYPIYFQQVRDYSVLQAGLLMVPQGIGAMAIMPFAGRISDRIGPRPLVFLGGVVGAVTMLVYATADPGRPLTLLMAASVLAGVGLGLIGPATIGSLYRSVPAHQISRGTSAMFILNQVGGAIGIAAFALIVQRLSESHAVGYAFERAFWVGFAEMFVVMGISQLLPGRVPADRPATSATTPLPHPGD